MFRFFVFYSGCSRTLGQWTIGQMQIFQLLSKQSGLLKENQNLQGEVALLRNRLTEAQQQQQSNNAASNRGIM